MELEALKNVSKTCFMYYKTKGRGRQSMPDQEVLIESCR